MKPVLWMMLAVATLGVELAAQGQLEYPLHRVRAKRSEALTVQPYYLDNRVVFRRWDIAAADQGMQISGEIVVDFDCDKSPDPKLPQGPVMGLKIDVQLYDTTQMLTRRQGVIEDIRVDVRSPGRPVEGQSTQCRTDQVENAPDARLATARFQLPPLPRPLAPGVYHLVASLNFLSQSPSQLEQIKWCSNFWGAEDMGLDDITQERKIFPIIGDTERHDKFFKEVTTLVRRVDGTARLYMADVVTSSGPAFRPAFTATERAPANYVIWDQLADRIGAVVELEGHPEAADKDLEDFKKNEQRQAAQLKLLQQINPKATVPDVIKHWEDLTAKIKKNAIENLRMLGDKASNEERRYHASSLAARGRVLEQIRDFQDFLVGRYWTLLDGYIHWGYHTVNKPGGHIYDALDADNTNKDFQRREEDLKAKGEEEAYIKGLREGSFKYQPAEVWKLAEAYLRKWPFKTVFLSQNFTKKEGNVVELDVAKWDTYRDQFMGPYLTETDKIFQEVDTSVKYANVLFPTALAEARTARDDVVCIAFAYEYQLRTDIMLSTEKNEKDAQRRAAWHKTQVDAVISDWNAKAAAEPERNLQQFHQASQKTPMAIHTQHRQRTASVKSAIKLEDFVKRYKDAVDKGELLPGSKKAK